VLPRENVRHGQPGDMPAVPNGIFASLLNLVTACADRSILGDWNFQC
jgi:hypothetical protein